MEQEQIRKIFERTNVQQIREFLVSGLELDQLDKRPYSDRLEDSSTHIVGRLRNNSKNDEEFSAIYEDFSEATLEYINVFLEIGMKAGARLLFQLLYENE